MAPDYYQILGVERDATAEAIKRAYRKLAHQHHPDKAGGDEEKFKQVNAAYQVLGDAEKRRQYDTFGSTGEGGGAGPGGFGGFNVNYEDLGGLGDIFEQFFGGSRRGRGERAVRRGTDVGVDIEISFIESATPQQRDITTTLYQACERCAGNGAEPGTPITTCTTCQGSGEVVTQRQTPFGVFAQATTCATCQGEGKQVTQPCRQCRGQGRERRERTLTVDIPAGIADGQTIRLSGKGEFPPRGGLPGDLYLTVHVAAHPQLTREGDTVRYTATVPFADAALGATIAVPTLAGTHELHLPAGTQPGQRFTLRSQGFPSIRSGRRGDQVVTVTLEVPRKLSRRQRELLTEFRHGARKRGLFR